MKTYCFLIEYCCCVSCEMFSSTILTRLLATWCSVEGAYPINIPEFTFSFTFTRFQSQLANTPLTLCLHFLVTDSKYSLPLSFRHGL